MLKKLIISATWLSLCIASPMAASMDRDIANLRCDMIKDGSIKTVVYFKIYTFDGNYVVELYNSEGEQVEYISRTRFTGENGVGKSMYGHNGGDGDGYIHDTNFSNTKFQFSLINSDPPYDGFKGEIDRVTGKVWIKDTIRKPLDATGICEPGEYSPPATKF